MRYSLVIDGNYFLFKTLYVASQSSGELLGTTEDREVYVRKLAIDLAYQIRLMDGFIDQVVWTLDSRSWRKDFFPQAEYKATRKQDSSINWDGFTQATADFRDILARHGAQISKVAGAEGDDLIYAWCTANMAAGKSTIIMTGDRDMMQLVSMNPAGSAHTMLWAPVQKQFYIPIGLKERITHQPSDFFESLRSSTSGHETITRLLETMPAKGKANIAEVDPVEVMFCKVLTGDTGDNVPPAYWYTTKDRNGKTRTYGVTLDKAMAVVEEFCKRHGELNPLFLHSAEHIRDLANILVRVANAKYMSPEQIIGNINVNVSLMILSARTIPEGILDEMFKHIEEQGDYRADMSRLINMKAMLEGTTYISEGGALQVTSSVLKEGDSGDFSFITDRKKPGAVF